MTKAQILALINTNHADLSNIVPQLTREIFYALLQGVSIKGEIKQIAIQTSAIPLHFDSSGLGKVGGEYETWAVCNGNNATIDMQGRVAIGYDQTNYAELGVPGGSKVYVLKAENLPKIEISECKETSVGDQSIPAGSVPYFSAVGRNIGDDKPFSLMQPYIVALFIQKL